MDNRNQGLNLVTGEVGTEENPNLWEHTLLSRTTSSVDISS